MKKDFKYVQGALSEGEEAIINFYSDVTEWSVYDFVGEFEWIANYIKPSKIIIRMNSAGGSVIDGMSAFSAIINCKIPTEVVVEGIAASMASILLAAGDVSKIRDYGLIMMHNPWAYGASDDDPGLIAFKLQLQSIYQSRWGLSEDAVTKIMEGPEGEDGTFMTAEQAVKAGIILPENVIITEAQKKAQIEARLTTVKNKTDYTKVFAQIIDGDISNKPSNNISATINQTTKESLTNTKNNMEKSFKMIAASLSMGKDVTEDDVLAKVESLKATAAKYNTLKSNHAALEISKAAVEADLTRTKEDLATANIAKLAAEASVATFEQEKADAIKAETDAFLDDAVKAGKITEEAKESWSTMAETNLDLVKSTLNSMAGRETISTSVGVANDITKADIKTQKVPSEEDELKTKEARSKAGIKDGFKFKTFND